MTSAAPQPADLAERAQPTQKLAAGAMRRLFVAVARALTQGGPQPSPPKKRRRSGADEMVRKRIRRLFRKIARKAGEDWRDAPASVDSDWWHWHRQSVADIGSDRAPPRAVRPGPDCASPTL